MSMKKKCPISKTPIAMAVAVLAVLGSLIPAYAQQSDNSKTTDNPDQGDLIPQRMLFGINSLACPTGHFLPHPVQTRLCNAFLSPAQPFQNSKFAW